MRKFKCIKSYGSGEWLTKGKIYTEDNGRFEYDDGWVDETFDYDVSHFEDGSTMSNYLEEIFDNQTPTLDNDTIIEKLKKHCSISSCEDCVLCDEWCEFEDPDTDELEYLYNLAFGNDQSNLVNSSESTFTITTSDTTTTLTDGTHTTSINRYYTDKHDDMVALEEVVKKYKSEIEETERKSKEPKVGDKVKVVDDGKVYSMYINWLITNNVSLESAIKWQCGKFPNNEEKYIIKEIHPHTELKKNVLALIEDEYNAYIINIEGLEVVK